jgi:signal transduction histidine kinase
MDSKVLKLVELHGLDPLVPFGPHAVIRSGEPQLQIDMDSAFLDGLARTPEHKEALHQLGWCSGMIIPLRTRGRTLGSISLYFSESGRRYAREDVDLALDLGRRCALCVDNARLYAEAQSAVRFRDEFLSIASHELKTPLTPLTLRLQTLQREAEGADADPLASSVRIHVGVALAQVRRLSDLVSNLLDVSRAGAGRLSLRLENVDGCAVVRDVIQRFAPQASQNGSRLNFQMPDEPIFGTWDRLRLEQILTNLVSNAVKYGDAKPIQIVVRDSGDCILLAVRDSGIGIATENLQRIFDRFERAVSEKNYGGLGLGLFITRQLVHALGGTIQVDSEEGFGSTFTVVLPKQPSTRTSELLAISPHPRLAPALR